MKSRKNFFLILALALISFPSLGQNREKFYIAEELFLSGEYVKSIGVFRSIDPKNLSQHEQNVLNYRLAFFTNITSAVTILSNSSLPEGRELLSFLLSYLGYETTNISDIINTRDEKEVYKVLEKTKNSGTPDIDLSIKLYFTLSNLKEDTPIRVEGEFHRVKGKFIEAIGYRNTGDERKFEEGVKEILSNYPDSFWAKLIRKTFDREKVVDEKTNIGVSMEERTTGTLKPGYYLVINKPTAVLKQSLDLKNFKFVEVGENLYIGPYPDQSSAQRDGERISKDYKVIVRMVRIREQ